MHFKDEADFNTAVRELFRAHGLQAVHVVETDTPGPLDLVVWKGHYLVGWIELKVDDNTTRPSQLEFMRNNLDCCIQIRWRNSTNRVYLEWPAKHNVPSFQMIWQNFSEWVLDLSNQASYSLGKL